MHGFAKFKERFKPVRHLGKGAFGSVFEVLDTHDNIAKALKIVMRLNFTLYLQQKSNKMFDSEVKLVRLLSSMGVRGKIY